MKQLAQVVANSKERTAQLEAEIESQRAAMMSESGHNTRLNTIENNISEIAGSITLLSQNVIRAWPRSMPQFRKPKKT